MSRSVASGAAVTTPTIRASEGSMEAVISSPTQLLEPDILEDPHGFAAGNASILDERGNGAIITWGFGRPVLRDVGASQKAGALPSLSLLLFSESGPTLWLHQRFSPREAHWEDTGRWRFGKTQIETLRDLKAQVFIAQINCALPGSRERLVGHIEMGGVPRRASAEGAAAPGPLMWSPRMGYGEGRAILQVGSRHHFHLAGRAAHAVESRRGPSAPDAVWVGQGHLPLQDRDLSFRVTLDQRGHGHAVAVAVDHEGYAELAHSLQAEAEGLPGAFSKLTLRDDEGTYLECQALGCIHDRGLESDWRVRGRAKMALPGLGLLHFTAASAPPSREHITQARRFIHKTDERAPLAVRLATGPARDRWRRALFLG